jgi:hypothetical protein
MKVTDTTKATLYIAKDTLFKTYESANAVCLLPTQNDPE